MIINDKEKEKLKKQYFLEQNKLKNQLKNNSVQIDQCIIDLKIANAAIDYLLATGHPICSLDFVGYWFTIKPDWHVNGLVDLHGNFGMYSTNIKRPVIPEKLEKKVLDKLLKNGFLEFVIEPFPEFSSQYNLSIDPDKTDFIPNALFKNLLPPDVLEQMRKEFLEEMQPYVNSEEG